MAAVKLILGESANTTVIVADTIAAECERGKHE